LIDRHVQMAVGILAGAVQNLVLVRPHIGEFFPGMNLELRRRRQYPSGR